MSRRRLLVIALVAACLPALPAVGRLAVGPPAGGDGTLRAGAAVVDATWHVGASAGQYASDGTPVHEDAFDPSAHSTRRAPSYGIESRSTVRALVVEEEGGQRFALVANDLYIPQALVNARVASILVAHDAQVAAGLVDGPATGIGWDNLAVAVSHSHTSPYYSTPSWGVWAFQDVFDIRFFEYVAQQMAAAVIEASGELRPARFGATTVPFDRTQRHSFGPAVADDGTPAGYPETDNDKVVDVLAFDDVATGDPIATWVTFGLHPEMLDGNDLLSGEYVGAMYRTVDRSTGGVTLFSQNNVGTAEPGRDARAQGPAERAEYAHREYAQMERAGHLLAATVLDARAGIEGGGGVVPWRTTGPVRVESQWFAPPGARAVPTVSSCRTEKAFAGNPGVPLAGLPDCEFPLGGTVPELPYDTRVTYRQLREAGIPVPDNTGAPSVTGLQETVAVHLQAMRIGPVGITVCPCEQWADQSRNIKSRLDTIDDNLWLGFDWTAQQTPAGRDWCVDNGDGTWTCADPRTRGATDLGAVTDEAYRRMAAQVGNDAAGWDEAEHALAAESDPVDPAAIWGNFTHEELTDDADFDGFDMVVTVGMANDYWGYIATYREFQRGDHYRKALTGLGPHSADFLATRLSRLAAGLAGYDGGTRRTPKDDLYAATEPPRVLAVAAAIGSAAGAYVPRYAATLPADGGAPAVVAQPAATIERFGVAEASWIGGSNWFDRPEVVVERQSAGGQWVPFGDLGGEVQARLELPALESAGDWRAGSHQWRWHARFETQSSDLERVALDGSPYRATPAGVYRFAITGHRHLGAGQVAPYALTSEPFVVAPWTGITVESIAVAGTDVVVDVGPTTARAVGAATYPIGPVDYPDAAVDPGFTFMNGQWEARTYGSPDPAVHELFCFHCTFEPRLDAADAAAVMVTVVRAGGGTDLVAAVAQGDGTWRAATALAAGDRAFVAAGGVTDADGNFNGSPSSEVTL